jgi:hypothetical protein
MPKFLNSLRAWKSDDFARILKSEIENLERGALPLEKGVSQGGVVDASELAVTVFGAADNGAAIQANVGVFFTEIVGGCSCGDEPVANDAYCEMQIRIDKATADVEIFILSN